VASSVACAACTDDIPPPPSELTITPNRAGVDQERDVIIRGQHLVSFAGTNFKTPENSYFVPVEMTIGGFDFIDSRTTGKDEITAKVPPFPDPAELELVVRDYYGRVVSVPRAFRIVESSCDNFNNSATGTDCNACEGERGCSCNDNGRCAPICGDGRIIPPESCDDDNLLVRDGCDVYCELEEGFSCTGAPSICTAICGDQKRLGAETCDDGNVAGGDGCNELCAEELGWACTGSPAGRSTCAPICSDRILIGSETCDDGNMVALDGCATDCRIEAGWTCPIVGEPCMPI
jgi:cysteine-rich repeat protein